MERKNIRSAKRIEEQMKKDNSNDICVSCGARSHYSKSEPTDHRYGYVEGVGQFCFRCAYFGGVENKVNGEDREN